MNVQKIINTYRFLFLCVIASAVALAVGSCSTTKRLEDGEVLYTGVKKISINTTDGDKFPGEVKSQVVEAVDVKPNGSLYSPYYRWPVQPGLWVYNNWNDSAKSGFKHWLYELLVSDPVLISDVKPELRVEMLNSVLNDNGYFGSKVEYELLYNKKDRKQARINYSIDVLPPYRYRNISFFKANTPLENTIDSLARRESHLREGARYCTDSLSVVRINITNYLRNKGYYFFRPEYIEFLADTTKTDARQVDMRLVLADNIPEKALQKYYVGNIEAVVQNYFGIGVPDTMVARNCTVVKYNPIRLRKNLVPSNISMRKGRLFTVRGLERTQENLSRLGIFSSVNIDVTPLDSVRGDTLDVTLRCRLDMPLETKFEIQAASKSNSYIGPSAVLGLTNKNIFGGGEQLRSELKFAYEWQTGKKAQSKLNTYEVGLNFTLAFPRLLAPKFVDRSRRYINWTNINMGFDLVNQPKYYKMFDFNIGFNWEWHANRHSLNSFSPFTLKYTHLFDYSDEFLEIVGSNASLADSYSSKFIPMMTYSYTYDRQISKNKKINWNITLSEAGNVAYCVMALAGSPKGTDEMEFFGTPMSQFVKLQTQLVYSYQFHPDNWLVTRVFLGAEHAYGNSADVPFSERFYVGGSNSIRAFPVRSIGPGSFHEDYAFYMFYNQTGTFKYEMNLEYRFPIFSVLKGAMFIDAGNVWLLKKLDYMPGGELTLKSFVKDMALGTGVGLRADMGFIVVRADLGIGLHNPTSDVTKYFNMPFKDSLSLHLAIGYPF